MVFIGFSLMCVLVYLGLEALAWQDALFWMIQPHAYPFYARAQRHKIILNFRVYRRFWFSDLGSGTGSSYDLQPARDGGLENHGERMPASTNCAITSSSAATGRWGGRWWINCSRLKIPFLLIYETNEGLCRELLKEKVLTIQGDAKNGTMCRGPPGLNARGACVL